MKLLDVYRSILEYSGLEADSEGYISTVVQDERSPAMLNGARMVLPTDAHLRNCNPTEKIIFHPLSENILRGESDIINKLRDVINIRLNYTFGIISYSLLNLAASREQHQKLTPDQTDLLVALSDADDISVKNFISLLSEGIKNQANKLFVNIYLKRGGSINGKRYSRAGIVTFNFYEELCKDSPDVFGTKLRVKDREIYKKLYKYILSDIDVGCVAYNCGSDSTVAPFLDALMKTSMTIASRLNDIVTQFSDYIDNSSALLFNGDWVETFENLHVLDSEMRMIPAQLGNEGSIVQGEKQQPQPQAPILPVNVPQQIQQPTQYSGYQQNTQYPPVQPGPPPIRQTNRGLDWNSVLQHAPQVGAQGNALGGYLYQQQYPQQQQFQPAAFAGGQPPNMYPYQNQGYQQPYQQTGVLPYINRNV